MHIQTHILSGWCAANCLPLTPRQRLCCMVAASVQDLDGLGIVFGQEAYWDYHHVVGHNLAAAVLTAVVLSWVSAARAGVFLLYLTLFHLHLALDYLGSGPLWPIHYLWPFHQLKFVNPYAWELFSWQNISAFTALLTWTVWIAARAGRTPLEAVMPGLDRQLVEMLRRRVGPKRPQEDSVASPY